MKKSFLVSTLIAASVLMAACSSNNTVDAPLNEVDAPLVTQSEYIEGQYIVVFEDASLNTQSIEGFSLSVASFAKNAGISDYKELPIINGFVAKGLSPLALQNLEESPRIAYIEQDQYGYALTTQNSATWGLDRIDQPDLPLNSRYEYNNTGDGVNVYVMDSGLNFSHTDFTNRIGAWYTFFVDANGDPDPRDCNGHGTHVAGTILGTTYGVAKQATVNPVRVLDCNGRGSYSDWIAGLNWIRQNRVDPAVVNMSLGGNPSAALDNAVTALINSGVPVAIAGGNENQDACNVSPARTPSAITVGATTRFDRKWQYSNYGRCIDILAPGHNVTSAWIGGNNRTSTISGTSMASPHVAGVIALYLEDHPNATPAQVRTALLDTSEEDTITGFSATTPNNFVQSNLGADGGDDGNDGGNGNNPCPACNSVTGFLSGSGQTFTYDEYEVESGTHKIYLEGPTNADFDLYLLKYSTNYGWQRVATSNLSGSSESISYSGTSGRYKVQVKSYSGSGNYTLYTDFPDAATDNGGNEPSDPNSPCPSCNSVTGFLSGSGQTFDYDQYNATSGTHKIYLEGPANADFDLYLFKYSATSGWQQVAKSEAAGSSESINYYGTSGRYGVQVKSYSGSGNYTLYTDLP